MELFQFEVRQDWEDYDRRNAAQFHWLWRMVQITVVTSAVVIFIMSWTAFSWPWGFIIRSFLSFTTFFIFTLWVFFHRQWNVYLRALPFFLMIVVCVLLSVFTQPVAVVGKPGVFASAWPAPLVVLVPAVGWLSLVWGTRQFPGEMRRLGLSFDRWPVNLGIGSACGAILVLHFLLATTLLPGFTNPLVSRLPVVAWTFVFFAGFAALSEEFLLRGLCFLLLYEESPRPNFWITTLQITLLNLLISVAPIPQSASWSWWLGTVVYTILFSTVATWLRFRQGSLLACIVCSVVFHTFMAAII